jgi:hypothetical protein
LTKNEIFHRIGGKTRRFPAFPPENFFPSSRVPPLGRKNNSHRFPFSDGPTPSPFSLIRLSAKLKISISSMWLQGAGMAASPVKTSAQEEIRELKKEQ